jgi:hypothetical protein
VEELVGTKKKKTGDEEFLTQFHSETPTTKNSSDKKILNSKTATKGFGQAEAVVVAAANQSEAKRTESGVSVQDAQATLAH